MRVCMCLPCSCREPVAHKAIINNVLEAYGHTPLIRLDKIAKSEGIECELGKFLTTTRPSDVIHEFLSYHVPAYANGACLHSLVHLFFTILLLVKLSVLLRRQEVVYFQQRSTLWNDLIQKGVPGLMFKRAYFREITKKKEANRGVTDNYRNESNKYLNKIKYFWHLNYMEYIN